MRILATLLLLTTTMIAGSSAGTCKKLGTKCNSYINKLLTMLTTKFACGDTIVCDVGSTSMSLDDEHMKFQFLFQNAAGPPAAGTEGRQSVVDKAFSHQTPLRHSRSHRVVRILLGLEILSSLCATALVLIPLAERTSHNPTWLEPASKTDTLPRLTLCAMLLVNILTALNVLLRMRDGNSCASTLMVHVIWKIVLSTVLMPTVALFSFIRFEEYMHSWPSRWLGARVLIAVWAYAVFSVFSIVLLSGMARLMWAKKARLRRNSFDSRISIIGASSELATLSTHDLLSQQNA